MVNAALGNKARFDEMRDFFDGVGTGHAAGVWEDMPKDRPEFREHASASCARRQARKAEEMI